MRCTHCHICHARVGWIGLISSLLIGSFTITIGLLSGSKALVASALCSGIDVATALTVILGLKLSGKPIDLEHPYGHGKVEFMVSGLISAFLIIGALILFYNSAMSIYNGDPGPEQLLTLAAALIAAVANEVKYRYAHCVGRQVNSPAVLSHAEHARIDAVTSALAGIGVVCARLGLHFVDPLLAMFDVVVQIKTSYRMLQSSVKSLMDLTLPEDKVRHIRDIIGAVEGVNEINYLYARQLGQHVWIELSIFLHPDITVYDGKVIAENVKDKILGNVEKIGNVQVQFLTRAA